MDKVPPNSSRVRVFDSPLKISLSLSLSEMTSQLPSAPLLDGNGDDNSPSRLMTASITSIVDLFSSKCYIVKPTDRLRKHDGASKIPASDLLLQYGENDLSHFVKVKVTDELKSTSLNELEKNIRELLTNLSKQFNGRTLIPAIAKCESETWINLSMLRRSIQNEAELRFALADPILRLICSFWNLTVCGWGHYVVAGAYCHI